MERWEREQILREGGVMPPGPREAAEARLLAEDLAESSLTGKPLPQRLRNFRQAVDGYVVSLGGIPAYMRRLAEIELETAAHEVDLERHWHRTALEADGDADAFARQWRTLAGKWSFSAVNDLIERHNRYYPTESRLPMDPRTGDFVPVAGRLYRRQPLDRDWVLVRFPPELQLAVEPAAAA